MSKIIHLSLAAFLTSGQYEVITRDIPVLFISPPSAGMIPPGTEIAYLNHSELFRDRRDAVGSIPHETAILT